MAISRRADQVAKAAPSKPAYLRRAKAAAFISIVASATYFLANYYPVTSQIDVFRLSPLLQDVRSASAKGARLKGILCVPTKDSEVWGGMYFVLDDRPGRLRVFFPTKGRWDDKKLYVSGYVYSDLAMIANEWVEISLIWKDAADVQPYDSVPRRERWYAVSPSEGD